MTEDDLEWAEVAWEQYEWWGSYTTMRDSTRQSLRVATAWDEESLVGLARVVGDGVSIVYLQGVLVEPDHERSGVEIRLVNAAFEPTTMRPVPRAACSRWLNRGGRGAAVGTSSRGPATIGEPAAARASSSLTPCFRAEARTITRRAPRRRARRGSLRNDSALRALHGP